MNYQLIFMPRSGSTWVCGLLNNEALGLKNLYEMLAAPEYPLALSLIADEEAADFSPALKIEIVDRALNYYGNNRLLGFKYEFGHIAADYAGFVQAMTYRMNKTIIMVRENPVQWALSQIHSLHMAQNNIAVNSSTITERHKQLKYSVNCGILEYYMVLHRFYMTFMSTTGEFFPNHLKIDYEQLRTNPEGLAQLIRNYLEIPEDVQLTSEFKKVRDDSLQYIENLDEVKQFLQKSRIDLALLQ